jgi:Protein of unknown function (DUF3667)
VSHSPQRKEKDCLNCGTIVQGHYCQHCGQENIEPKETFWHMVTHFFYDITHFDGSFFVTLKDLLIKPGFLTKEYMKGRRKTYLHPVRMYVFTSAVFFLVFYSMFGFSEDDGTAGSEATAVFSTEQKKKTLANAQTKEDSVAITKAIAILDLAGKKEQVSNDTLKPGKGKYKGEGIQFDFGDANDYKSLEEYDSIQKQLPETEKDNWFERLMMRKTIAMSVKYKGDESKMGVKLWGKFMHTFPYILFVSLPLYALFLKLLYRRHKNFFFADHGVFLIHLYIFTFLVLLIYFSIDKAEDATGWRWLGILQALLLVSGFVYTVKAIKYFYEQGWGKTILKFIIFNILCLVTLIILFAGFMLLTFFQI